MGSDEAFWSKYSDEEGKPLCFQQIFDILQGTSKDEDQLHAHQALWFFDNDLTQPGAHGYFHYKKTGRLHVCTKKQTIAQKWRNLLNEQPDVAQQWELVRYRFDSEEC